MIAPTARLIALAAIVLLPALALMPWIPAVGLAALLICGAAAAMDAMRGRRRLSVLRVRLPEVVRVTKNTSTHVPLTLENTAGQPMRVRAGIVLPQGLESEFETQSLSVPHGVSQLPWACAGRRRGAYRLDQVYLECRSPLALWDVREPRATACEIRVYPNLRDRHTAALLLRSRGPGARVVRQVGKGREFERLRDYTPGDTYDDISWKATARRGRPVTRLFEVEHSQAVYVAIDASRLSARDNAIERYVEASLHLAIAVERQGDRFGLIAFSDRVHAFVPAASGAGHFRTCREAIYDLHTRRVSPDFREVFTTIRSVLQRRSLLVFLTALDDPLLADAFSEEVRLISRRHVVLAALLRTPGVQPLFEEAPPETEEGLYRGLAGQILWNKLQVLRKTLGGRGVRLALIDGPTIKPALASLYLDVKRRQAL